MWIPARIKHLGTVDLAPALKALSCLEEGRWYENDELKQQLAGNRPTNSLFFYSMNFPEFRSLIVNRPIEQVDVPTFPAYDYLYDEFKYLFDAIFDYFPKGGVFVRAQLARMKPGSEISPHLDAYAILESCHRIHIPIITNSKVRFMVDGELVRMEAGNIYELNNQLEHSVVNPKDSKDRIHLILDYLPPEYNIAACLGENFKFRIKQERSKKIERIEQPKIPMPKVIATSVVRGANQNESHGGVYLVDMETEQVDQMVDWNTCDIDFSGRGWDRGLRGICFLGEEIIIAASDELFFYSKNFKVIKSFRNQYLRHAHEIMIDGRFLYVTSTGFDSVLRFNLRKETFDLGWKFHLNEDKIISVKNFDPCKSGVNSESNIFHINNAFFNNGSLYISGRQLANLLVVNDKIVKEVAQIPRGTHNVYKFGKGIVYNDTESDQVVYSGNYDYRAVKLPTYSFNELIGGNLGDEKLARPGFGRGLCKYKKGTVIVGSSPSTISLIDFKSTSLIKSVNISRDVRNAIHGLELWPY